MAATEPVVTEIVITAQQAEATLARIEAAYSHLGDRAEAAQARATAAWERQMQSLTKLPQSIERVSAAYERIQGSLNPVVAAQQRAEREMTQSLAVINRAVLLNVTTEEQAAKDIAALRNKQIADIARVREAQLRGAAANQNNRFAALNATNQFQDIAVTAAMGQSVGTIALQQGTQLGMALQQSLGDKGAAGAAKILGSALTGLFTPINLIAIGLTALVAVGIKLVNWGQTAATVVLAVAHVLPQIAEYAAVAATGLALLYAPAVLAGLTVLSEAILGIAAQLVGLAIGFVLANPGIAFIAGITAIIVAMNLFRDQIQQTFGVDVVGIVKDSANKVIGLFVGAYNYVADTWRQLPDLLSGLARLAINNLIDEFSKPWLTFNGKVLIGGFDTSSMKTQLTDAEKQAMASGSATFGDAMSKDYVGEFGSAIAKGAGIATDKLKELAKWLTTVKDKSKKSHGKTEEEKFEDIVTRAQGRVNVLKAEQAGLGMTDLAAAKLRYETELLNEAKRKDITLTADQRAKLVGLADQMATTEVATKKMRDQMQFERDATKGFLDDLRQGLQNGESFWKSFGDAALGVLNKIIDKIENQLLDAIFKANDAGSSGGGSILGSIFSGIGSLFGFGGASADPWAGLRVASANGNVFGSPALSAYSNSIVDRPTIFPFANGIGLMGEKGQPGEAIMPLMRNSRGQLGVAAANDRAANQNSPVIQIIDQRSGGTIEREDRDGVTRLIVRDEIKRSGVGTVANHVRNHQEAKKRSMIK